MTPTPERALAFAKALKDSADESRPRTWAEREQRIVLLADHAEEIARMLTHYAEILPKWQAVLDAGPANEAIQQAAMLIADHFDYPWQYMPEQGRAGLRGLARKVAAIIKPAP